MSSIRFRQKALDHNKPLPILREEDHPDVLLETAALSRSVPDIPTGMEKEEEEEVHVKQIIDQKNRKGALAQLSIEIPIPEITRGVTLFKELHSPDYRLPSHYIKPSLLSCLEEQPPEYDMDDEDAEWLEAYNKDRTEKLSPLGFEKMMDAIEQHHPMTLERICEVANYSKDSLAPVYKHYVRRLGQVKSETLMPRVKTSAPNASSKADPYIAFRRRVERMQTRKNRQQNEAHFMNMLKLRRDLHSVREMLGMIVAREDAKTKVVDSEIMVLKRRYEARDFDGSLLRECMPWLQPTPSAKAPQPAPTQPQAKPAKHRKSASAAATTAAAATPAAQQKPPLVRLNLAAIGQAEAKRPKKKRKEEEEDLVYVDTSAVTEPEYDREDPFRFRRRTNVFYHAPLQRQSWWCNRKGRYRHFGQRHEVDMSSPATPPRLPLLRGFCRRRIGRGGRVILDRSHPAYDRLNQLAQPEPEQLEDEQDMRIPKQLLFMRHLPATAPTAPAPIVPAAGTAAPTTAATAPAAGSANAQGAALPRRPPSNGFGGAAHPQAQAPQMAPVSTGDAASAAPSTRGDASTVAQPPANPGADANAAAGGSGRGDDPKRYPSSGTMFAEVGSHHFYGELQHKRQHPPSP